LQQQQQQQPQQPQQPSPPNSLPENDDKQDKKEMTVVLEQLTQHTFDNPNLQQFYAILNPTNSTTTATTTSYQTISSTTLLFPTTMPLFDDVSFQRSHGVIGSIDAVVVDVGGGAAAAVTQENAAAFVSSSHSSSNPDPTTNSTTVVTTVELRNLRVHQCARRCGIGKALIQAVQRHTQEEVKSIMRVDGGEATKVAKGVVYLEVDSNNEGAIQLYQQMGFVWDAQIADRMNWVCVM
jgi:ribosomal protein S18 acetylase RimI-like enzyme